MNIEIDLEPGALYANLKANLKNQQDLVLRSLRATIKDLENNARERMEGFIRAVEGKTAACDACEQSLPDLINQATIAVTQFLEVSLEKPAGFAAKFSTMQVPAGRYRAVFLLFDASPQAATGNRATQQQYELLAKSIDGAALSVRTTNVLKTAGVQTVGDLCQLCAADILRWRNSGRKPLKELRELLASVGLKLQGDT